MKLLLLILCIISLSCTRKAQTIEKKGKNGDAKVGKESPSGVIDDGSDLGDGPSYDDDDESGSTPLPKDNNDDQKGGDSSPKPDDKKEIPQPDEKEKPEEKKEPEPEKKKPEPKKMLELEIGGKKVKIDWDGKKSKLKNLTAVVTKKEKEASPKEKEKEIGLMSLKDLANEIIETRSDNAILGFEEADEQIRLKYVGKEITLEFNEDGDKTGGPIFKTIDLDEGNSTFEFLINGITESIANIRGLKIKAKISSYSAESERFKVGLDNAKIID